MTDDRSPEPAARSWPEPGPTQAPAPALAPPRPVAALGAPRPPRVIRAPLMRLHPCHVPLLGEVRLLGALRALCAKGAAVGPRITSDGAISTCRAADRPSVRRSSSSVTAIRPISGRG